MATIGNGNTATATDILLEHNADGTHKTSVGAPSNVIVHTTDTSAPTGWVEFTAGRGRVIVGTPSGGTHAGTVGTAFTDVEARTHVHAQNMGGGGVATTVNYIVASSSSGTEMVQATAGTGASRVQTGVAATGDLIPYIQQLGIKKS